MTIMLLVSLYTYNDTLYESTNLCTSESNDSWLGLKYIHMDIQRRREKDDKKMLCVDCLDCFKIFVVVLSVDIVLVIIE